MRLWHWGVDSYNTGYKIFTLIYSMRLGIDCYLFYFPTGSYIPKHKDPNKFGKQYRFNIIIKKAKKGGEFLCKKNIFSINNRIYFFRADKEYHKVTKVIEGSRFVLSFGFFI